MQLVGEIETKSSNEIALWIRDKVADRTGCSVSIGIGPNLVLAKLAGQKAKPSSSDTQSKHVGVYRVDRASSIEFMRLMSLSEIPGVGER